MVSLLRRHREDGALPPDAAWFWTTAAVLTLIMALPVLFAWLKTPPGYSYTGFLAGRDDYFTYLEKMREGWQGDWLFTNRYSLEPHRPALIFAFYLALGHLCRLFSLPLWAGYHLARLLLFPAALAAIWAFLGTQMRAAWQRRWALLLTFGLSGFGVFAADGSKLLKLELHLGEHLYLAALYPHYLLDGIALCWTLVFFLRYLQAPRRRWLALSALCLWVLALVHPFLALPALAVPAAYILLFCRRSLRRALLWGLTLTLAVAPPMAYMAWALYGDRVLATWRTQAIARPFSPGLQLIWFGVGGALAVYGAWRILSRPPDGEQPALAITWVGVDLVLINSGLIGNALEFALFLGTPLAVLVTCGLEPLRQRWQRPVPAAVFKAALIMSLGFSCLIMLTSAVLSPFVADAALRNRYYLSPGYRDALDYIAAHSDAHTITLSSFTAANQLPAYGPGRVYMGHAVETLDFPRKYEGARAFYTGELSAVQARGFVQGEGVQFVLEDRFSLYDMHSGGTPWVPGLTHYPFLEPVYSTADATVYRVTG